MRARSAAAASHRKISLSPRWADVKNVVIVATHHKTGTVWMRSVFLRIAKKLGVPFLFIEQLSGTDPAALVAPSIIFDNHAAFHNCRWLLKRPDSRIIHLIRDPRDVIISGMAYHRTASEPWLLRPRQSFGGLTYQEKINSLPDDQARYIFEMHNSANKTIRAMKKWNYKRKNSFECRYEDLIKDTNMEIFTSALLCLGFEGEELDICRKIFKRNSLFGKAKPNKSHHIRSGDPRQWMHTFNPLLAKEFVAQFGDVLIELGYEPDNAWVDAVPPTSEDGHALARQELGV